MYQTLSQKISDARLMIAGIKGNLEILKSIGLNEQNAQEIETALAKVQELDTKQERLKAELKVCTAELNDFSKQMDSLVRSSRKRVKLAVPQAGWKEFGIQDRR